MLQADLVSTLICLPGAGAQSFFGVLLEPVGPDFAEGGFGFNCSFFLNRVFPIGQFAIEPLDPFTSLLNRQVWEQPYSFSVWTPIDSPGPVERLNASLSDAER